MAEVKESSILIQDVETRNIMTKSTLPVGGYSVNPYVGCTHGCKYCYASFMKRFTGHTEPGYIPGCETLASNQKSTKVQRAAHSHRFCDRWLSAPGGSVSKHPKAS